MDNLIATTPKNSREEIRVAVRLVPALDIGAARSHFYSFVENCESALNNLPLSRYPLAPERAERAPTRIGSLEFLNLSHVHNYTSTLHPAVDHMG